MVGGDREVFDRVAPVLQAIGRDRLFYVGESGSGAVCKLVNNLQVYVIQSSLAEALTLGRLAGVSVERLVEVIGRSTGQSRVADDFQESLAQRDAYDGTAGFPLWIGRKDTRLATDFGRELDYPMPLANEVDALFTEWMSRGWHNKGIEVQMMIDEALARLGQDGIGGKRRAATRPRGTAARIRALSARPAAAAPRQGPPPRSRVCSLGPRPKPAGVDKD